MPVVGLARAFGGGHQVGQRRIKPTDPPVLKGHARAFGGNGDRVQRAHDRETVRTQTEIPAAQIGAGIKAAIDIADQEDVLDGLAVDRKVDVVEEFDIDKVAAQDIQIHPGLIKAGICGQSSHLGLRFDNGGLQPFAGHPARVNA